MPILFSDDDGYYTMSTEWFKEYVYNIVIHKDFVSEDLQKKLQKKLIDE